MNMMRRMARLLALMIGTFPLGSYVSLVECANAGYAAFEQLSAMDSFGFRYYGAFSVQ